ncbi:hypothetical protein KIN20_013458 [Parelaphostrongylus tenuis]|uniref:Uncharacterized protein n=1 Tax=Parelaphostrongylus tenuis TaxID=148309 RepID=A0AAD5MC59_PARTN|nr:hypothetical protein KIN20_013458 [Parelaphostrongylus tenuis]
MINIASGANRFGLAVGVPRKVQRKLLTGSRMVDFTRILPRGTVTKNNSSLDYNCLWQ